MITTINNEHKKLNVPNKREQNQTCLDSAEREGLRPKGNVPNLRFPEFQGEWEYFLINDVCSEFKSGKNIKADSVFECGEYPVYGGNGLRGYTSSYNHEGSYVLIGRQGALCGNVRSVYGKTYITEHAIAVAGNEKSNTNFLHYLFLKMNLGQYSDQSAQPGLAVNKLLKLKVALPVISEQTKIAKLLSLLDERIATQNKIIDKLQSLIKGIVDCTILHKEKNAIVGDVCSISEQIRAEANIDDIITVRLHGNGVCKSSAENLQLGATQYYRRKAGQLIYGKQNFHNGAIGIVPISLDNGITSKDIPSFDIDEMKCNSVYLLAQLQSPQYYKPAEALTTGTGSKRLKEETFLKMPIVLPNKREQDNIAVLIHRASMNLEHAKRLLVLLSIQKQFLLRQMFI